MKHKLAGNENEAYLGQELAWTADARHHASMEPGQALFYGSMNTSSCLRQLIIELTEEPTLRELASRRRLG